MSFHLVLLTYFSLISANNSIDSFTTVFIPDIVRGCKQCVKKVKQASNKVHPMVQLDNMDAGNKGSSSHNNSGDANLRSQDALCMDCLPGHQMSEDVHCGFTNAAYEGTPPPTPPPSVKCHYKVLQLNLSHPIIKATYNIGQYSTGPYLITI